MADPQFRLVRDTKGNNAGDTAIREYQRRQNKREYYSCPRIFSMTWRNQSEFGILISPLKTLFALIPRAVRSCITRQRDLCWLIVGLI